MDTRTMKILLLLLIGSCCHAFFISLHVRTVREGKSWKAVLINTSGLTLTTRISGKVTVYDSITRLPVRTQEIRLRGIHLAPRQFCETLIIHDIHNATVQYQLSFLDLGESFQDDFHAA